jgi:diguanylate cyclase (GGDEF)-like protein
MGTRFAIGYAPVVIGRDPDSDLCINHFSVSRRHARILPGADGYRVTDMDSTNGTFVNEAPAPAPLRDGDYLRVGGCILRFLAGDNVEAEYHEELYRLAITEALTGLANRRRLLEALDWELARAARFHRPLSLALFDLDHFKAINDRLGHLAGDAALQEFAARARTTVRKEALLARYGGEEFALLLPEADAAGAATAAARVRTLVEAAPFLYRGEPYRVTVSAGVATTPGDPSLTPERLIDAADAKLAEAKRTGRNRIAC